MVKQTTQIPDFEDWKREQPIVINVQLDTDNQRVLDTSYYSIEDLELNLSKLGRILEDGLRQDYNDEFNLDKWGDPLEGEDDE